jgi:replication-associated recombination protein RarA
MSVQSQLKALQQEISGITARQADAKKALAAAEQAGDGAEVVLQRKRVLQLGEQKRILREQQNVLLEILLAPGQLCLLPSPLAQLCPYVILLGLALGL